MYDRIISNSLYQLLMAIILLIKFYKLPKKSSIKIYSFQFFLNITDKTTNFIVDHFYNKLFSYISSRITNSILKSMGILRILVRTVILPNCFPK